MLATLTDRAPVTTQDSEFAVSPSLFHMKVTHYDAHGRHIWGFLVSLTCTLLRHKTGDLQSAEITFL